MRRFILFTDISDGAQERRFLRRAQGEVSLFVFEIINLKRCGSPFSQIPLGSEFKTLSYGDRLSQHSFLAVVASPGLDARLLSDRSTFGPRKVDNSK